MQDGLDLAWHNRSRDRSRSMTGPNLWKIPLTCTEDWYESAVIDPHRDLTDMPSSDDQIIDQSIK